MNDLVTKSPEVQPEMIRRACGGWLAISQNDAKFKIGVTAPTAELALEEFRTVCNRWIEIRGLDVPKSDDYIDSTRS